MTQHPRARNTASLVILFEELSAQWASQTRAYLRSRQMFEEAARRRTRLPRQRSARAWLLTSPRDGHSAGERNAGDAARSAPTRASTAPLTRRQFEIAQLIAEGLSNEEIARRLVLTPGTVGNHVGHILRRLGARNRAQVAAWVTEIGAQHAPNRDWAS